MRKPAETDDDVAMLLGIAQRYLVLELSRGVVLKLVEQSDARVLVQQIFRVFERHVEEASLVDLESSVLAQMNTPMSCVQGQCVLVVGLLISSELVSLKLIA